MTYPYHTDMPSKELTADELEMERTHQLALHHSRMKRERDNVVSELSPTNTCTEDVTRMWLSIFLREIFNHQRAIKEATNG